MKEVINIKKKFELFDERWTPKIVGECNGNMVKIAKVEGDFVWHHHEKEDELFYVVKGQLIIEYRDSEIVLNEGEMHIVPKGIEHKPKSEKETWIMLFEPGSTKHTGEFQSEITQNNQEKI